MKTSLLKTLSLALLLTASARAELPEEVAAVLERNIEVTGGRERFAEIKTTVMTGTLSIPMMGMSGENVVIQVYPDKMYTKQSLPGYGDMVQAYDGDKGWTSDPMQGFRYLSEAEISSLKQSENWAEALNYDELYSSGELLPESEVDGEPVQVVKLVSAGSGLEQTRFFSVATGHMIQQSIVNDLGAMGKIPVTLRFKEFQEHEGIVYPQVLEMSNAGVDIRVTFSGIEINTPVDESIFTAPQ